MCSGGWRTDCCCRRRRCGDDVQWRGKLTKVAKIGHDLCKETLYFPAEFIFAADDVTQSSLVVVYLYNIIYHINNNNKKNTCNLARGVRKTRYLVQTMLVGPYIYDPRAGSRIPTMTAARKSPCVRVCICGVV